MVRWRWIDCFTRKRIEKTLLFTEYYACIIIWRIFIREYACLCAELRYWIVSEQEIWRKCPFLSGLKYHRCSSNMAETLNLGLDSSSRIDRFTGWNPLPFFSFFFFSSILYLYHCCLCIVYRVSMMEYRVCLLYPDAFFLFYSSFRATSAMLHFDACRSFIIEREIFVKFVEFKNFFFHDNSTIHLDLFHLRYYYYYYFFFIRTNDRFSRSL